MRIKCVSFKNIWNGEFILLHLLHLKMQIKNSCPLTTIFLRLAFNLQMVSLPTAVLNAKSKLWFWWNDILTLRSLLQLFLHPFCLFWLSRESSISNIHEIIYKISCTLKVTVCTMQPHAPFTWNETKSFACSLCNWQKKIQLLSRRTSGTRLVIRAKFIFWGSRNEELMCIKHCKCEPGECRQFKSQSSKRSSLFKKALANDLNWNSSSAPGISAYVHYRQCCGYAVSIPNTVKTS